jgi:hypothetical protein
MFNSFCYGLKLRRAEWAADGRMPLSVLPLHRGGEIIRPASRESISDKRKEVTRKGTSKEFVMNITPKETLAWRFR